MKTVKTTQDPHTAPSDVDEALAQIEKGQQMAGHFPDEQALERARRVLTGELSEEDAVAEILRKYAKR